MAASISKAEQSERTRRALLDAALELFAEHGYANISTEEIVRRAAVTRGALYYHFRDKVGLFAAVYEEQNVATVQAVTERVQVADGDLWQRVVVTTCQAFVEQAADPRAQRILFVDSPVVLGRTAMLRTGPGLELARQAFAVLASAGLLDPLPLDPLVHLLWAMFFEAGRHLAHADDTPRAQEEILTMLLRVFDGLRPRP